VESPAFDPNDVTSLKVKLQERLSSRVGALEIRDLRRIGAGMDTYVYAFAVDGSLAPNWMEPLVLRVYPNVGQAAKAEREASIQGFVREGGFPAPRPLLVDAPGGSVGLPFMVMERAPGTPLVDRMKNPLSLVSAISAMAALQARLHSMPTEGCPVPYDGPDRSPCRTEDRYRVPPGRP
jgi:aminoglycoside phosphotransferase (APT) family kinase protein